MCLVLKKLTTGGDILIGHYTGWIVYPGFRNNIGNPSPMHVIYSIGHSTRSFEELLAMLRSFDIKILADIRAYPGSRRYPHFNKDSLEQTLPAAGIKYLHFKELGGRRKPAKDSKNTAWRNEAFRGYADHMETPEFKTAANSLMKYAEETCVAYKCSEAVWWRCHRALLSDYLKIRNWNVMHIMSVGKSEEHPYTGAAKILDGHLSYSQ